MGFSPPRFPSAGNGAYTNDLVLVWTDIEGKVKVLACLDAYANMVGRVRSKGLLSPSIGVFMASPADRRPGIGTVGVRPESLLGH
jgi:hypothetical protein